MKTVIFSDMHNREFIVKDLFNKIGLMDDKGNRVEGFKTIQLGDLLSLGYGEQEANFYKFVKPFIDIQLIGNHEYPAFGTFADYMQFIGYESRDIVAEQFLRHDYIESRMYRNETKWIPSTYVGNWLVSHAGLSVAYQNEIIEELGIEQPTAKDISSYINTTYLECEQQKTYKDFLYNTGVNTGGIFWHRIQYLRAGYTNKHISQIVGHTPFTENLPVPSYQNKDRNLICIDTMGDCVALVTDDDGLTWEMYRTDYTVKYTEPRNSTRLHTRECTDTRYPI